uniref:Docking protein 2 n=1 Tax=Cyclopterus lumpus TaxID=8103 RepID=A0A8C2WQ85_CYCLU
MEEDIRKQGTLYLQQQKFGKKWKRIWCVLFRESSCSIARLEFFDCKGVTAEKSRKQQENKKVIRLSDCIRVSEVEMDGCPRDTEPFLIETSEKIYVFSADRLQLEDWTHKLCEIAFPMNWTEAGGRRSSLLRGRGADEEAGMEDNSLYSGREKVRDFRVSVRRTEASDRCRLKGDGFLRADVDALLLLKKTGDIVSTWPYRYLRRFGQDKSTFSFEAGRRCDSGEGSFEFDTKQGNFLFQAVEAAINLQRISFPQRQTSCQTSPETPQDKTSPPLPLNPPLVQSRTPPLPQLRGHARPEPSVDKLLTGVRSLTLDPRGVPRKNQVKSISSCPLPHAEPPEPPGSGHDSNPDRTHARTAPPEPEYSLPFDTIATTFVSDILDSRRALGAEAADPLYDSIDEMKIRNVLADGKTQHIYDEPEGCAAPQPPTAVYDDPEEVRGGAWRLMAADPKGHEYPYDPRVDDYAVPKRAQRVLPVTQSTNEEKDGEEEPQEEDQEERRDSPYSNVRMKMV